MNNGKQDGKIQGEGGEGVVVFALLKLAQQVCVENPRTQL